MELIYIGDNFYSDSGTVMSPIYTIDGHRSHWGKVQLALEKGESVYIRPATESEIAPYQHRLQKLLHEKANESLGTG